MVIGMGRRHCGDDLDYPKPFVRPEPPLFVVKKGVYVNGYSILKIWYSNAENCSGDKILVFRGVVANNLNNFDDVDPHFREEGGPIARFHPSQMGWSHALLFVENL